MTYFHTKREHNMKSKTKKTKKKLTARKPQAVTTRKARPPKKMKPKERAERAKRDSAAINPPDTREQLARASVQQENIDEARAAPITIPKAVHIGVGVYQTANRSSAIAYQVSKSKVAFLTFINGIVEHHVWSHDRFAHEFEFALPDYPLRRAARIYLNSFLTKTDNAARALRAILRS